MKRPIVHSLHSRGSVEKTDQSLTSSRTPATDSSARRIIGGIFLVHFRWFGYNRASLSKVANSLCKTFQLVLLISCRPGSQEELKMKFGYFDIVTRVCDHAAGYAAAVDQLPRLPGVLRNHLEHRGGYSSIATRAAEADTLQV